MQYNLYGRTSDLIAILIASLTSIVYIFFFGILPVIKHRQYMSKLRSHIVSTEGISSLEEGLKFKGEQMSTITGKPAILAEDTKGDEVGIELLSIPIFKIWRLESTWPIWKYFWKLLNVYSWAWSVWGVWKAKANMLCDQVLSYFNKNSNSQNQRLIIVLKVTGVSSEVIVRLIDYVHNQLRTIVEQGLIQVYSAKLINGKYTFNKVIPE